MNLEELRKYKAQIMKLAEENGISNIRVFGSVARGEATDNSDVDLLVEVGREKKGVAWNYIDFHLGMQDLLNRKVDLVTEKAINKRIKDKVLSEAQPL